MSYTLFDFGPYQVCLWNLVALFMIFFVAFIFQKVIHRSMRRYLIGVNIKLEGRRATWLRLASQSVYILAGYVAFLSFNINNNDVSFREFLEHDIIRSNRIRINFAQIMSIVVIGFSARILMNFLKLYYSRKFRGKADYNPSTEYVYVQISKYIIYIIAFFLCVRELDINAGVFLGGSAALLVGLGLGLQDVFKDMFSGVVLLFEGSLKIGDVIELQDSKFKEPIIAKVLKINVRTTQIETRDGNVLLIPNAKLTQEYVENWSHGSDTSRFLIDVTVAYNSNTEQVCNLLRQAALSHPKVKKTQPVQVRMKNFGHKGLELELIFWADQGWEASNYKSEVRFEIDRLFRQYDIRIPYPHQRIIVSEEAFEPRNQYDSSLEN